MKVDPKILEDEKIIVRYYRTEKHGSITVCARFIKADDGEKFAIGVAFCSPIEKQFDKQLGKTIALGRLMRKRERGYAWTSINGDESVDALIFHLLCTLQDSQDAERLGHRLQSARWFSEFLKEMLKMRRRQEQKDEARVSER